MRVFVINLRNEPLMPTTPRKARLLLKQNKAKVVSIKPFTIQLLYATGETKQPVTLGIDSGYSHIGFSAVTEKKEVMSGEANLLQGVSKRLKERRAYRKSRRNRKRHRKPRFDNRKRNDGWLAPSIQHKLDSHIRFIKYLQSIMPVTKTVVEVANFDIQKIKNPDIEGKDYQQGEQLGFWNLREYIFHRDNYTCQNPNCKPKTNKLQVHHVGYWKDDMSDRPTNLAALCVNCHVPANHKKGNFLYGWEPKLNSFKTETFMSMVRWRLVNILNCQHIYGYITKGCRIDLGLGKSHLNDAFVIAGGTTEQRATPLDFKQIRRNNRSLEKFYDAKYIDVRTGKKVSGQDLFCGRRTRNKNNSTENLHKYRGEKLSKGRRSIRRQRYPYQPHDLVRFNGSIHEVAGVQNKGAYIKLKGIKKVPKIELVSPYRFMKGIA